MQEYLNLLAAAEIAQGHHAMHEIILTAMNKGLFTELLATTRGKIWDRIDYTNSYRSFLNEQFKNTAAYSNLMLRYPQYLHPENKLIAKQLETIHQEKNNKLLFVQKYIRASKAYAELNGGSYWHLPEAITKNETMSHAQFKALSNKNIHTLVSELGELSDNEKKLFYSFMSTNFELTHNTKANDFEKIKASSKLLSYSVLKKKYGDGNFKNNSDMHDDLRQLKNGDFVYFRFELSHIKSSSRFGDCHLVFDGRQSGLLDNGWISVYEMLYPQRISIVKKIKHNDKIVRSYESKSSCHITFQYNGSELAEIDLMTTVFYGPDILKGIALAMIRELRRIGGDFQKDYLESDLSLQKLNDLLAQLFRVEAKIPSSVNLLDKKYTLWLPDAVKKTIQSEKEVDLEQLINEGVDINKSCSGSAIFYACELEKDSGLKMINTLYENHSAQFIDESGNTAGHVAAQHGNIECLKTCLNFIPIDAQDKSGATMLFKASEANQVNIVQHLISQSATLTLQNKNGLNPLHIALQNKQLDCARILLTYPSLNVPDKHNKTPLLYAIETGNFELVKALFDKAPESFSALTKQNENALHLAIKSKNEDFILKIIDLLISTNQKHAINAVDDEGNIPLFMATWNKHEKVVKKLIALNVDIQVKHKEFGLILSLAADFANLSQKSDQATACQSIFQCIYEASNPETINASFNQAVETVNIHLFQCLKRAGFDVFQKSINGKTFFRAAMESKTKAWRAIDYIWQDFDTSYIIENLDDDLNKLNDDGENILVNILNSHLQDHDKIQIFKKLVKKNSNLVQKNEYGSSACHQNQWHNLFIKQMKNTQSFKFITSKNSANKSLLDYIIQPYYECNFLEKCIDNIHKLPTNSNELIITMIYKIILRYNDIFKPIMIILKNNPELMTQMLDPVRLRMNIESTNEVFRFVSHLTDEGKSEFIKSGNRTLGTVTTSSELFFIFPLFSSKQKVQLITADNRISNIIKSPACLLSVLEAIEQEDRMTLIHNKPEILNSIQSLEDFLKILTKLPDHSKLKVDLIQYSVIESKPETSNSSKTQKIKDWVILLQDKDKLQLIKKLDISSIQNLETLEIFLKEIQINDASIVSELKHHWWKTNLISIIETLKTYSNPEDGLVINNLGQTLEHKMHAFFEEETNKYPNNQKEAFSKFQKACLDEIDNLDKQFINNEEWKPLLAHLDLFFTVVDSGTAISSLGQRFATGQFLLFDNKKKSKTIRDCYGH